LYTWKELWKTLAGSLGDILDTTDWIWELSLGLADMPYIVIGYFDFLYKPSCWIYKLDFILFLHVLYPSFPPKSSVCMCEKIKSLNPRAWLLPGDSGAETFGMEFWENLWK
jgi:hypothetical protein